MRKIFLFLLIINNLIFAGNISKLVKSYKNNLKTELNIYLKRAKKNINLDNITLPKGILGGWYKSKNNYIFSVKDYTGWNKMDFNGVKSITFDKFLNIKKITYSKNIKSFVRKVAMSNSLVKRKSKTTARQLKKILNIDFYKTVTTNCPKNKIKSILYSESPTFSYQKNCKEKSR